VREMALLERNMEIIDTTGEDQAKPIR
jgi:hypothetical protein